MATVTLPHTSKADSAPNLFSEVKANDQAIIDQVNGNLDSTNLADNSVGSSEIAADAVGASEIAAGAVGDSEISDSYIVAGTYLSVATNVTNVTASTPRTIGYLRVGTSVMVFGELDLTPTTGGIATELGLSLPIASNLANSHDLGGAAAARTAQEAWRVGADTVNDRAQFRALAVDSTSHTISFSFGYQIK